MRTLTLSFTIIGAVLLATVHAAPAKQLHDRSDKLSCDWDAALSGRQLGATDFLYGSHADAVNVGYKSFTEGGKEIFRVVKVDANDTSISPLQSVTMLPCNSDALNYPEAGGFGQGTAVKLLSGIGRHGIAYCVGIQDHNSNPTDVVLAPCDYYDGDAQLNQFWQRRYIYNNFVPLVRKANGSNGLNDSDSWPILPPADNAEVQNYRAGHDGRDNTTYLSFTLSGMSD